MWNLVDRECGRAGEVEPKEGSFGTGRTVVSGYHQNHTSTSRCHVVVQSYHS